MSTRNALTQLSWAVLPPLYVAIALSLFAPILAGSTLVTPWIRLGLGVATWILTVAHPGAGLCSVAASVVWYEVPSLRLGAPNQFLIEGSMAGFVLGSLCSRRKQLSADTPAFLQATLLHPLVLPWAFAIMIGTLGFSAALGQQHALAFDFLSRGRAVTAFLRDLWLWDVLSPTHGLTVLLAWSLQVLFILETQAVLTLYQRSAWTVRTAFLCGAIPVFAYAWCQWFEVPGFPIEFSVDIGGTMQNGNHLAYYAALVLLTGLLSRSPDDLRSSAETPARPFSLLSLAFVTMAFAMILIGKGRASLFGVLLVGAGLAFVRWRSWAKPAINTPYDRVRALTRNHRTWFGVGVVAMLTLALLLVTLAGTDFASLVLSDIKKVLRGDFLGILFSNNRRENIMAGLSLAKNHLGLGIGAGNFFVRSEADIALHNGFLALLVEFGMGAMVALATSASLLFAYLLTLRRERKQLPLLAIAVAAFCALVLIVDPILDYRSLLTATSLIFSLGLHPVLTHRPPSYTLMTPAWIATLVLGFLMGIATIQHPVSGGLVQSGGRLTLGPRIDPPGATGEVCYELARPRCIPGRIAGWVADVDKTVVLPPRPDTTDLLTVLSQHSATALPCRRPEATVCLCNNTSHLQHRPLRLIALLGAPTDDWLLKPLPGLERTPPVHADGRFGFAPRDPRLKCEELIVHQP